MRRLIWVLAAVGAAVWSGLAWGVSGLVGAAGRVAGRNADVLTGHPETVEWLSWAAGLAASLGQAGVVVVWLAGLAAIFAVPLLMTALARAGSGRLPGSRFDPGRALRR